MSDQRKTISIDPALLGRTISGSKTKTNSTRKRREKPTTQVNASTLRRALIERIKLKRAEEKKNNIKIYECCLNMQINIILKLINNKIKFIIKLKN